MITFLSKLGGIIVKSIGIATGLMPIVQGFLPQGAQGSTQVVTNDLNAISKVIVDVEAIGQALSLKGPDKLKAAAPLISQIILASSVFTHAKIADQAKFDQGVSSIASGFADVLNSIHPDAAGEAKKTT